MLDKLGRELKVGDIIVYGNSIGRSCTIKVGKILDLAQANTNYGPQDRIKVQGIDEHRWLGREAQLGRPGILLYADRTLVISREQVPTKYLTLLDSIKEQK